MTYKPRHLLESFDSYSVPSPCYLIDETALENNLKILSNVEKASGAKILLALKAFSMHACAPLIGKYLSGTCASGLYEARLGAEKFSGEVHTYSPAYRPHEFAEVLKYSDHIVFNSFSQWQTYKQQAQEAKINKSHLSFGLRINPEHSEGTTAIYDPCAPCSRMGITKQNFNIDQLDGIEGLHFHTLCEQNYEPLARTLDVVEQLYGEILPNLKWINFGGGHHITRADYKVDKLIQHLKQFQTKYKLQVYLEPGEAVALNAGVLIAEVLDIVDNGMKIAILDTSATCHMPDVLEMPYRPNITGADVVDRLSHNYRLAGPSCLSGDVIGDYSFDHELKIGDRLMFEDMAIYTMVKNTTFNGVPLPTIALTNSQNKTTQIIKSFNYCDFLNRLS